MQLLQENATKIKQNKKLLNPIKNKRLTQVIFFCHAINVKLFFLKHITITYILSPLKITQQNISPGYIYLAITFLFYLADEFKVELYHTKEADWISENDCRQL